MKKLVRESRHRKFWSWFKDEFLSLEKVRGTTLLRRTTSPDRFAVTLSFSRRGSLRQERGEVVRPYSKL
jgi:hypothetical protein